MNHPALAIVLFVGSFLSTSSSPRTSFPTAQRSMLGAHMTPDQATPYVKISLAAQLDLEDHVRLATPAIVGS